MCNWSIFGARTSHEQTRTHKTHHGPDLGKATTFPLIVFSMFGHRVYTQMSFCPRIFKLGVSKFSKSGLLWLWRLITFCVDLRLRWNLKQSCSPCWEFSNSMLHATFTQVNQGDSWLLLVWNQIGNLSFGLSFGHTLCFKYPNGSCELILDIYFARTFQWYKELFNPMSFDHDNRPLKIQKSTGTPTPKVGVHLGMWGFIPSHSLTLLGAWNVILRLHFWLTPL